MEPFGCLSPADSHGALILWCEEEAEPKGRSISWWQTGSPKPVFIRREWRTAARQRLPTLILSISGSLSNDRVNESGDCVYCKGLPCAHPGSLPWRVRKTLLAAALRRCSKTWWHGHCQMWGVPSRTDLGSETPPEQLVGGQREGSGVWHLPLAVPGAPCPHSCMWLHRETAPMHPQPAHLSNSLRLQLVRALPNSCILLLLDQVFLKHILYFPWEGHSRSDHNIRKYQTN